ncbi:MAG: TIGR02466 family protein [Rhodospirillales bacterium]
MNDKPAPGLLDLSVQSLFGTPLAVLTVPDATRLNAALSAVILGRARATPSVAASNLGGWQSSWDFAEWGGEAGRRILDIGKQAANRLTANRQGRQVNVPWKVNAWANVNHRGDANEFHTHPGAYWSGVYYVDDGGIADDPSLGGELEVQDPRGVLPAMYAPALTFNVPGGQTVGSSELLRPRAGMMTLFPSWVSHQVRPYRGDRVRISLAFNLSV